MTGWTVDDCTKALQVLNVYDEGAWGQAHPVNRRFHWREGQDPRVLFNTVEWNAGWLRSLDSDRLARLLRAIEAFQGVPPDE